MGQVLIAGITFAALVTVGTFVFGQDGPSYAPQIEVQQWLDPSSDVLYLKHSGGESLSFRDLDVIVNVDGDKKVLTDQEISECLGKNSWDPGDVIVVDIHEMWGIQLENEDCVDVFLVDRESNKLIYRATMSMEGVCSPLLELGKWYFFTTVVGDDSDEVNLGHLKDCGLNVDFYPASLGDSSKDVLLGKDETGYFAENAFPHNMKDDALDLTFGFKEEDFKGFKSLPHNATILMIFGLQIQPTNGTLTIAGESMPVLNAVNSGNKNWFIYNKTVPINISNVSELKFSLHLDPENKDINIDYLSVYLS